MVTVSIPCWLMWAGETYEWQVPGPTGTVTMSPLQGAALLAHVESGSARSIRAWIRSHRLAQEATRELEQAARCSLSEELVTRMRRAGRLPEDPGPFGLLVGIQVSTSSSEVNRIEYLSAETCRLHLQMVEGTDPSIIDLHLGDGGARLIEVAA